LVAYWWYCREAQAVYEQLEDFKRVKIAVLMKRAEAHGIKTTAAQEREAMADPEYQTFLVGKQAAHEKALALKQQLKALELRFEYFRTMQATKRAEMVMR